MRRTPALIVGGGPAGAAAAILLAGGGTTPLLIERKSRAGGTVCGGFLGWDALASLEALGVDAFALGGHPIDHVRLVAGRRVVEARLPHRAAGLSRLVLDEALLARAGEAGARIERGIAVRRIEDRVVDLAGGGRIAADTLFVATGKHGLRGLPPRRAGAGSVGLRAVIDGAADLHGMVELHMLRGGYAGLLIQEDGRANLCISVAAARLREAGGRADLLLAALAREAPLLLDRIGRAPLDWDTIAGVPYGWRAGGAAPSRYLLGDQAAVIASLAGDGVAIALASGRAGATAFLAGTDAAAFQRDFSRRARAPLRAAEWVRSCAERPATARLLLAAARLPGAAGVAARLTRIGY